MTFTTFGIPGACGERPLQQATIARRGWRVRVGRRVYRIGTPRGRLPRRARRSRRRGGGYVLATVPFVGGRTPSVVARVAGGRVHRFELFIGGGGD